MLSQNVSVQTNASNDVYFCVPRPQQGILSVDGHETRQEMLPQENESETEQKPGT